MPYAPLTPTSIVKVLTDLGYRAVETSLGPGVEMNALDAFIFAATTGAAYQEDSYLPFRPKGLMRLSNIATTWSFVAGILSEDSFLNTPSVLVHHRPYLTQGPKTVIPIESKSEVEMQDLVARHIGPGEGVNTLLLRLDLSKRGRGLEGFLEFVACEYFRRRGFFVENQLPLSAASGSPDFGAYKLPRFAAGIKDCIKTGVGCHVFELACIRAFRGISRFGDFVASDLDSTSFVVGEAKTGGSNAVPQLEKFLHTGYFENSLEILDAARRAEAAVRHWVMTITNDGVVRCNFRRQGKDVEFDDNQSATYRDWLEKYCKVYLLANLTVEELQVLRQSSEIDSTYSLRDSLAILSNKLDTVEIVNTYLR